MSYHTSLNILQLYLVLPQHTVFLPSLLSHLQNGWNNQNLVVPSTAHALKDNPKQRNKGSDHKRKKI